MATLNHEQVLEEARKLTEKRMESIRKITDAVSARTEAEDALRKAQLAEKKAYTDAEKNGWSKAELNKLFPAKKTRRAPKPKAGSATSPTDSGATLEH